MNSTMQICFYEETINVPIADTLLTFQIVIGQKFFLDSQDVNELIIYFVAGIKKYPILNQHDYSRAISFLQDPHNQKLDMKFHLEVSEKSRLFNAEVVTKKNPQSEKDKENQEKVKMEILEKELKLKQLLEKERNSKLKAEKLQREKSEKKEKEKLEAELLAKAKAFTETVEADHFAKANVVKMNMEALAKAMLEKERDALKASISKAVVEALNSNLEKFNREIMEKALVDTARAIEKSILLKSGSSNKNDFVHEGTKCINCGMCPIRGNRYQCSVCLNCDLCNECEEIVGEAHPHGFLKFRRDQSKKVGGEDTEFMKLVFQRLGEIKEQYDLSGFQDKQIIDALIKCNGNADDALEILFE